MKGNKMTYKHTEGPWEVQGDTYVTINSLIIAHCKQDGHTSLDEAMANANLIKAAPDLLVALEHAVRVCEASDDKTGLAFSILTNARAAISRARG